MRLFTLAVLILATSCARKRQQTSDTDHSIDTTSITASTIEQSDSLAVDEMVGIWQESPEIGSDYMDYYRFLSDGSFRFVYNGMICDKRITGYSGTWEIHGDKLTLFVTTKSVIVGGKLVPTGGAGSCASDYYIEGGEKKDIEFKDLQIAVLSETTVDSAKYEFKRRTFNGKPFWRIED